MVTYRFNPKTGNMDKGIVGAIKDKVFSLTGDDPKEVVCSETIRAYKRQENLWEANSQLYDESVGDPILNKIRKYLGERADYTHAEIIEDIADITTQWHNNRDWVTSLNWLDSKYGEGTSRTALEPVYEAVRIAIQHNKDGNSSVTSEEAVKLFAHISDRIIQHDWAGKALRYSKSINGLEDVPSGKGIFSKIRKHSRRASNAELEHLSEKLYEIAGKI